MLATSIPLDRRRHLFVLLMQELNSVRLPCFYEQEMNSPSGEFLQNYQIVKRVVEEVWILARLNLRWKKWRFWGPTTRRTVAVAVSAWSENYGEFEYLICSDNDYWQGRRSTKLAMERCGWKRPQTLSEHYPLSNEEAVIIGQILLFCGAYQNCPQDFRNSKYPLDADGTVRLQTPVAVAF